MDDVLIGFDIRELWITTESEWDAKRKREYLLRSDIVKPLSADPMIWKSVFDLDSRLTRPPWVGPVQDHWDDCDALLEFYSSRLESDSARPACAIGISCSKAARDHHVDELLQQIVLPTNPLRPRTSWRFLGFDIVNRWLLSPLFNGGSMSESLAESLAHRYGHGLNSYHLFEGMSIACAYCDYCNEHPIDDPPLFVVELWGVQQFGEWLDTLAPRYCQGE